MIRVYDIQDGNEMLIQGQETFGDDMVTSKAFVTPPTGVITNSTVSRTLTAADNGRDIVFTNASASTLTLAAGLGAGFRVRVWQGAAGQVTLAAGGQTMTIRGGLTKTASAGAMVTVFASAANVFLVDGGLA